MPPSPSLRCSPGTERRMESSTHKRGRSFESGLYLRAKEDDLALFNEMQKHEKDNFLLHTSDDFDDSISKLRYFSDFNLGINIPSRGESNDLLNADGEKNDYDWLLTPPDTPLFPSLDDEERQSVSLAPRGRQRSQPISISRSSMTEKTQRSSRSSASPNRLSPSPRSSSDVVHMRARSSSAPRSSSPPVLRSSTPSRRPSTPPTKPSTPTLRSSTPTLRRMSTGSSSQAFSSGRRGISPVKASRGNSASPKLRGWQSNLPGFSSDAPPNLRTSLSDRPTSRARGLSPAYGSGMVSSSKSRTQSMSPTPSRSVSSSRSLERDNFSSYSRASAASSGEDDVDSIHSVPVGISGNSAARKSGVLTNSRAIAFSRKPSRTPSASSAPKRTFDSALRQMDHRKAPQNMFRPLLSSVPASTFYAGKTNSVHRPMFSRNSSLTTSSNASSEHGASVAPDLEDNDQVTVQNDLVGECKKTIDLDIPEEVFVFDGVDEVNEDNVHDNSAEKLQTDDKNFDKKQTNKIDLWEAESSTCDSGEATHIAAAPLPSFAAENHSAVDQCVMMAVCFICRKKFQVTDIDGDTNICQDCAAKDELHAPGESRNTMLVTQGETVHSDISTETGVLCSEAQLKMGMPELPEINSSQVMLEHQDSKCEEAPGSFPDKRLLVDQRQQQHFEQRLDDQSEVLALESGDGSKCQQSQPIDPPSLRVNHPEGTGMSVLLQRSSSSKWPVVQGRAFATTNILCSEPSYIRDSMSAMKRSIGRDSVSASSSVDLGSSRQTECRVQRQLSSRIGEVDKLISDYNTNTQNSGSQLGILINASAAAVCSNSETDEEFDSLVEVVGNKALKGAMLAAEERNDSLDETELNATEYSSIRRAFVHGTDTSVCADSCIAQNDSESQLSIHRKSIDLHDNLEVESLSDGNLIACKNDDKDPFRNKERSTISPNISMPSDMPDSFFIGEDHLCQYVDCQDEISNTAAHSSSFLVVGEQNNHGSGQDSQVERTPFQILSNMEALKEGCVSITSDQDASVSMEALHEGFVTTTLNQDQLVPALGSEGPPCHINEPTITIEGPSRRVTRSLTLEEATDTILFCSSIIHDLAYKAASIGMEKESLPPEAPRPTITLLGRSVPGQKDLPKVSTKRVPNCHKVRRKKLDPEIKVPPPESGHSVKEPEVMPSKKLEVMPSKQEVSNATDCAKPPKLESRCNCTVM